MSALVALGLGVAALVAGTALGWQGGVAGAIVTPPALVRAALVAGSTVLGVWLLLGALARIADAQADDARAAGTQAADAPPSDSRAADAQLAALSPARRDLRGLVRAVRLVFLAVGAFAAAGGWVLGSPLPLIVALVIAGIDVVETSFLLLGSGPAAP